jgi:hypothetical protein
MMSNYGFDDNEDFTPPPLPKRKTSVDKVNIKTAVKAGNDMGFVPRDLPPVQKTEGRDRRSLNKEPQGKILITGPERVLGKLRDMSIKRNEPYWKVIESLLDGRKI